MRYLVLVLLLSGCAETMIARARDRCTGFGYRLGTEAHALCVQTESEGSYIK